MRALLLLLALFFATPVFAQTGRPGVVLETVADAMARKARAGEEIQIRNYSTNILWSAPRSFTEYLRSVVTNAHDGVHYITNSRPDAASVWVSSDRFAISQKAEWWGAQGDDALDDAAAVQAAIDWLDGRTETWSGVTNAVAGEVVMPAGNLVFNSTVLVDGPFAIRGAGRESTVIACTSTNDGFNVTIPYYAGQYSFAYLHDFSLYKPLSSRTGNGIYQAGTGSQLIAERINITGFANGMQLNGWTGSYRDILIQETGSNSVWVPPIELPFTHNPTSSQFERVLVKNGVGHGFNIENSSYFSFFSCYSEKHTNGIGWRIVATPTEGVAGNNYAIQMENCASEFDLVALEASRTPSMRWTGGMFIPRNETTNVVRFIGPVQAKLDGVEVVLSYTPSLAGYTVWTEDDAFGGWPNDIQIVGGQWRRLSSGLENRPGTVKWVDSFTNPSPFRDLPADAPSITSTASSGAIAFNLTGHEINTNAFTLYLDATWPEYNSASSEIVVHSSTSQTIWANPNAFFLAQFNDAKFGAGSYNPDSANSLSLRATNTLFSFSGKRTRILFSRAADGARLWVDGKRIPLETAATGSGGNIATNVVSGPWLHFGSLLGATRWRYHGGGVINHAITDDAQAYRITLRGPDADLPWASFGTGTNGVVAAWRVTANGDFRDAGPLKLPAYQIGTLKQNGIGDDLWTTYGRREFIATNATASSQFRQTYGTSLASYAEIANAYGGLLLVDTTNSAAQKVARMGMPNYDGYGTAPLGLVGGVSYSGGGDVNFGGYNSSLFTKPSQYLWAYGSTHTDTTGWLGMYASRGNGLHLVNPPNLRLGTNLTSGQHSVLAHVETGRLQIVAPTQIEFWANSGDREALFTTNGLTIETGKSIVFGGVSRTNWPSGGSFSFSDLTNALLMGSNMSAVYTSTNMTISSSGGGGATNGTPVSVDGGAALSAANFADGSRIGFSASGTNVTADIVGGSVRTNELDSAAISYLTSWSSLTGTPTTLSGYGITDAQGLNDYLTDLSGITGLAGTMLYFDGVNLSPLAVGTSGQVLTLSGTTPGWATPTSGTQVFIDGSSLANPNFADSSTVAVAASGTNVTYSLVDGSITTNKIDATFHSLLVAGGGGGTSVFVDGASVSNPNFADSAELLVAAASTNVTYALASASIATNKIDSTFRSWVESMATGGVVSSNVPVALTLLTTTGSVTNSTTNEVSLISTVTGNSVTNLDANSLASGATLHLKAHGTFTATGDYPDARFRFKVGGYTAVAQFDEPSSYNPSAAAWVADVYVTVVTAGASATVRTFGTLAYQSAGNATANETGLRAFTGSGTLDTTATAALGFTFESDPDATTTMIGTGVTVERIGQNITVAAVGSTNLVSSSAAGLAPQATLANAVLGTGASGNVAWTTTPSIAGGIVVGTNTTDNPVIAFYGTNVNSGSVQGGYLINRDYGVGFDDNNVVLGSVSGTHSSNIRLQVDGWNTTGNVGNHIGFNMGGSIASQVTVKRTASGDAQLSIRGDNFADQTDTTEEAHLEMASTGLRIAPMKGIFEIHSTNGTMRVRGQTVPAFAATSEGLEFAYDTDDTSFGGNGLGSILSYDRGGSAWSALRLRGITVNLGSTASSTELVVTNGRVTISGDLFLGSTNVAAALAAGGGGGTSVFVDGSSVSNPNWISSADITNVITSTTNIAPTIRSASVSTNKIDSTFRAWVESMATGGGAAPTKTIASFRAQQGEPPASNYATFSTRNSIGTALFDHTTSESLRFRWVVPEGYTNTVVDVVLKWTTSATSGDGRWGAQNARLAGDIDSVSFGTAVEATTTTSATAGTVMTTTLEDVTLNSAVAGDWVWTEIYRDDLGGADTINSNDLELHAVEVRAP